MNLWALDQNQNLVRLWWGVDSSRTLFSSTTSSVVFYWPLVAEVTYCAFIKVRKEIWSHEEMFCFMLWSSDLCSVCQVTLRCSWRPVWRCDRPFCITCCRPWWPTWAWWPGSWSDTTQTTSACGYSPWQPGSSCMWRWWTWWVNHKHKHARQDAVSLEQSLVSAVIRRASGCCRVFVTWTAVWEYFSSPGKFQNNTASLLRLNRSECRHWFSQIDPIQLIKLRMFLSKLKLEVVQRTFLQISHFINDFCLKAANE